MKNYFAFSLLLAVVILSSCQKDDESDYNIKRSNLFGEWEVTTQSNSGIDNTFTLIINEDGTGSKSTILQEDDISFEWIYQYDPEKIVLKEFVGSLSLGNTTFYSITKNKVDEQTWTSEAVDLSGGPLTVSFTWELERP